MSDKIKNHKDLEVWKQSIGSVDAVYRMTKTFPPEELYGLVSQMRRAAVSIPSNIAEGAARASKKEFTQFLYIALGSVSELETQTIISKRLGYIDQEGELLHQTETARRLLLGLIKHLKKKAA
jgi:four helix bundle protein